MNWINANLKLIIAVIIVALLVLAGVGYSVYQKGQQQQSANLSADAAQRVAREEVRKLVAEVGKLIDLPPGEDPTVATVTDVTKLKDQPFFQKAKNGDKVLIYTQARKAYLYDPAAKKIIDVAPINIGTGSAQVSQFKVALRNGTTTVGLTSKVETELKKSLPQLNVVSKDNAQKTTYDKTIVVVINSVAKDYANELVKQLKGASLGDLPAGENQPKDVDLLVILGKDRI